MREIKFRVWDKARKCWLDSTEISLHCFTNYYISFEGNVVGFSGAICDSTSVSIENLNWLSIAPGQKAQEVKAADRFVIQEFTGIKDRNNKDIYEGDIVNVNEMNRTIVWRGSGFYCTWSEYALDTCWFLGGGPKVVGNIFENPELCER